MQIFNRAYFNFNLRAKIKPNAYNRADCDEAARSEMLERMKQKFDPESFARLLARQGVFVTDLSGYGVRIKESK